MQSGLQPVQTSNLLIKPTRFQAQVQPNRQTIKNESACWLKRTPSVRHFCLASMSFSIIKSHASFVFNSHSTQSKSELTLDVSVSGALMAMRVMVKPQMMSLIGSLVRTAKIRQTSFIIANAALCQGRENRLRVRNLSRTYAPVNTYALVDRELEIADESLELGSPKSKNNLSDVSQPVAFPCLQ